LRELFAALGNDPFVIAECLARPALADRLLTNWYAYDERMHGELKHRAEAQLRIHGGIEQMKQTSEMYREIELLKANNLPDEADRSAAHGVKVNRAEWNETVQRLAAIYTEHAPKPSAEAYESMPIGKLSPLQEGETCYYATAILTKTADRLKLATVAWLKEPLGSWLARAENQGNTAITVPNGNYTLPQNSSSVGGCTEGTWTPTSAPPDGRVGHTAVWNGSEMIVWGGFEPGFFFTPPFNTGGRYDPGTDNWTTTSLTNAPAGRYDHTAVWTGSEMIVWGGFIGTGAVNSGGRYNPGTDSWAATSASNAPVARSGHTTVWTGNQMIIWGGRGNNNSNPLNTGGRYNPGLNSWTATSTTNAPTARSGHTAVWTGSQMIIWGGFVNTGGLYNPITNSWTATSTINAPDARQNHRAVWTGSAMIIWGGDNGGSSFRTGGKYFPATNTWAATTMTGAPRLDRFLQQSGLAMK
jgi:Galactose oxidase, central domain